MQHEVDKCVLTAHASVRQMCVANWVMTPPPMGMKEDFILDTIKSMEVTGENPVFRVKPQLPNLYNLSVNTAVSSE